MLTRIEIDGFKSFENFELDLAPFTVILGPNASGKSNLFDAIRLLSRTAGHDLRTAVHELRGEPHELFRLQPDGTPADRMALAVEVLLDPKIRDPWGAVVELTHSRVRYELEIERRRDARGIERLVVAREAGLPILRKDDSWLPGARPFSPEFRRTFLRYNRSKAWLTTEGADSSTTFKICQDGRKGRARPGEWAEASILSSISSTEFPHLYALREELRSWLFLQLDPASLRRPSPITAGERLEPDGNNLATVLARIQAETGTPTRPKGVLADIAADLAALIPGVVDLDVQEDTGNREYRIDIEVRDGTTFTSRVVSDGTLRVLALLTLLHDPQHGGLICFEEPENGIHPLRLKSLVRRLRELVTDPQGDEEEPPPLSQMLLSSHSPVVLSDLTEGQMLFADTVSIVDPGASRIRRATRILPVRHGPPYSAPASDGMSVSPFEVRRYLSSVEREA